MLIKLVLLITKTVTHKKVLIFSLFFMSKKCLRDFYDYFNLQFSFLMGLFMIHSCSNGTTLLSFKKLSTLLSSKAQCNWRNYFPNSMQCSKTCLKYFFITQCWSRRCELFERACRLMRCYDCLLKFNNLSCLRDKKFDSEMNNSFELLSGKMAFDVLIFEK